MSLHGKRALDAIRYFPTPVVALVNGTALGGGAELALACDLRIAAPHATLGLIHARLAITPAWRGAVDLMQLTGYATATRLLARGDILTSGEAHALGGQARLVLGRRPGWRNRRRTSKRLPRSRARY